MKRARKGTAHKNLLTLLVKNAMREGWEPIGGVALAVNKMGIAVVNCTSAQAMVLDQAEVPLRPNLTGDT